MNRVKITSEDGTAITTRVVLVTDDGEILSLGLQALGESP